MTKIDFQKKNLRIVFPKIVLVFTITLFQTQLDLTKKKQMKTTSKIGGPG